MQITLLPLLGAWHLRYPAYNTESVLELTRAADPEVIVTGPLPQGVASPDWQDTPEIALPSVALWAQRRQQGRQRVRLEPGMAASPDPNAEPDFRRYAGLYPQTRELLTGLDALLRPLGDLLPQPLTLRRIWEEVVPTLAAYQREREATFGDGPGTDWWRERVGALAARIRALPETRVTVLVSAEQLPFLLEALHGGSEHGALTVLTPHDAPTDERTRERALLDIAFRGDAADPGRLIAQLRELDGAEARFHEANLLLAHGHLAEALALLEGAANGDFSAPYYLPGYLLTRLGQVRDLTGDRRGAERAYRGVLALDWVPLDAKEAAQTGLAAPFEGVPAA